MKGGGRTSMRGWGDPVKTHPRRPAQREWRKQSRVWEASASVVRKLPDETRREAPLGLGLCVASCQPQ